MALSSFFLLSIYYQIFIGSIFAPKGAFVFIDDVNILSTHSSFLDQIYKIENIVNVTVSSRQNKEIKFKHYDKFLYSNLVMIVSSLKKLPTGFSISIITEFLDQGGNLLLITDSNAGTIVRRLVKECGYELMETSKMVVDPVNFDSSDKRSRTMLLIDPVTQLISGNGVFKDRPKSLVLFQGTGLIPLKTNTLVETIVASSDTAYTDDITDQFEIIKHTLYVNKIPLIGSIKMRNDARAVISGSIDFFSNSFYNAYPRSIYQSTDSDKISGNRQAAEQLLLWSFCKQGIIRVSFMEHTSHRLKTTLSEYNVEEPMDYTIQLEEITFNREYSVTSMEQTKWLPYVASDIQFEFFRIDPFIRQTYNSTNLLGKYIVTFTVPDVIGIYKLRTFYSPPGYNRLMHEAKVIVRPRKHDDFPRFVYPAYPYYATCITMMALSYLLLFLVVHYKENDEKILKSDKKLK